MKTIKYIIVGISSIIFWAQIPMMAEEKPNDSVHLKKSLTKKSEGVYTINLETYVSGSSTTTITETTDPVDIVLVLDVSGSMDAASNHVIPVTSPTKLPAGKTLSSSTTYMIDRMDANGNVTRYYFRYLDRSASGSNSARGWYICADDTFSANNRIRIQAGTGDYTVSDDDSIYVYTGTIAKIEILKSAALDFIKYVAQKNVNGVVNNIGIVTFSPQLDAKHCDYDKKSSNTWYGAVTNSTLGPATTENLQTIVKGLEAKGGTLSDGALYHAQNVLSTATNKKVVVFFTDGTPGLSGWSNDVATSAENIAKSLKANNTTIFSIGIFNHNDANYTNGNIDDFMNKVSSNYDKDGKKVTNSTVNYYQESNGSDLSSIFTSIAEGSLNDQTNKSLNTESSAVIDIVSSNFSIPEGAENLKISFKALTGDSPEPDPKATQEQKEAHETNNWTEIKTRADAASLKYDFDPKSISATIDHDNSTVTVPGFNFGKADIWNSDDTAVLTNGHWVGPRDINGVISHWGIKMVVSFDVKLDPEYEGGFDVPSNTAQSGLYLKDDDTGKYTINVGYYGVPTEDFPAICIIKRGLDENESALFTATQQDGRTYKVPLIQKTNNNAKLPCYAIVKGLDGGKTVTVSEQSWSWLYGQAAEQSQTLYSLQSASATKDDILKNGEDVLFNTGVNNVVIGRKKQYTTSDGNKVTFAVLARESRNGVWTPLPEKGNDEAIRQYSGAVVLLFEFTNVKNTSGKPARSEAYVHNKFIGGTNKNEEGAEAGGNEEEGLESGGNEEGGEL